MRYPYRRRAVARPDVSPENKPMMWGWPLFVRARFDRGDNYCAWITDSKGQKHGGLDIDLFHTIYRRRQ